MGKKDKSKNKIKGAVKTIIKTDKKLMAKQKRMLEKIGEKDIAEMVAQLEKTEAERKVITETIIESPSPRTMFSMCSHPDREEFILFGGEYFDGKQLSVYNDLIFYNIPKNEWKSIKSPAGPGPRSSHQMCSVSIDGGQLWLFGGEHSSASQIQFYHYKDLWVYHLNTKSWEKIPYEIGPSPRSGHRMVVLKKSLFVFGGFYDIGTSYKYFNDLWQFSLETYQWQEIKVAVSGSTIPQPRSACCMAVTPENKILVWGGYSRTTIKKDVDRGITHSDMFALVPVAASSASATTSTGGQGDNKKKKDKSSSSSSTVNDNWKWVSVKASGVRPPPRCSVNNVVAQNGKCYQFGGVADILEDDDVIRGDFSNDLHMLQLSNQVWRQITLTGPVKEPKKKSNNDKEMEDKEEDTKTAKVSTDGVFTMTVGSGNSATTTEKLSSDNKKSAQAFIPSERMKSGLVVCKGILYLYGGVCEVDDKQKTYSDLYSLDLHKLDTWKTIIKNDDAMDWIGSDSESDNDSDGEDDDEDEDDNSDDSDDDDDDGSSSGMELD